MKEIYVKAHTHLIGCPRLSISTIPHPSPMFPGGLVNQVIVPVGVVVAVAVTTVVTVIILIDIGCVGESFLAQCDEFIILINALVMWLSCPDMKCSDKPCRRLSSACDQVKWQQVHIGSVLCSPLGAWMT